MDSAEVDAAWDLQVACRARKARGAGQRPSPPDQFARAPSVMDGLHDLTAMTNDAFVLEKMVNIAL